MVFQRKEIRNIVIVNDNGSIQGGADMVAISSAVGLAESGLHVVFFSATLPVAESLSKAGVETVCLGICDILHDKNRLRAMKNGIYNSEASKIFRNILASYSIEDTIIHVHTWTKALSSAIFSVSGKMGFHCVLTLHDFFTVCPNGGLYNYNRESICKIRPMSAKCLMSNCDLRSYSQKIWRVLRQEIQNSNIKNVQHLHLLAVSKKVEDIVRCYLPPPKAQITLFPNPIDILRSDPVELNPDGKYLFMGRLAKEKGPELFCEAISQLGLRGVMVGDGYLRKQLENKYPNIEFAGWLSGTDKLRAVRDCKCFVFTTRLYETFGLVVAEMKALGIPSIVPIESAAAEQIEDGKNGFLYHSGDLESLKTAIRRFEELNLEKIQKYVIESFSRDCLSLSGHVTNLIKLYNDILNNN